jgi:hypothetical protein
VTGFAVSSSALSRQQTQLSLEVRVTVRHDTFDEQDTRGRSFQSTQTDSERAALLAVQDSVGVAVPADNPPVGFWGSIGLLVRPWPDEASWELPCTYRPG